MATALDNHSHRTNERTRLRVLVVDDYEDCAETTARLLRVFGHDVTICKNGWAALDAVRSAVPEVVLLDIGLPGMDGFEVARQIRAYPGIGTLLIIAMTGYGQDGDRRRSAEAGIDLHLVKPVDIGQLEVILREYSQVIDTNPAGNENDGPIVELT